MKNNKEGFSNKVKSYFWLSVLSFGLGTGYLILNSESNVDELDNNSKVVVPTLEATPSEQVTAVSHTDRYPTPTPIETPKPLATPKSGQ
jgi:hypothetical protein